MPGERGPVYVRRMVRPTQLLYLGLLAVQLSLLPACKQATTGPRRVDGGRFEIPDSGLIRDAFVVTNPDAAAPDAMPFVCTSSCAGSTVCSCLDNRPPTCGCNPPGAYDDPCDRQVPESCGPTFRCSQARTTDGTRYICSDGREGTPCTPSDPSCNTSNGCVCLTTPVGVGCVCQGDPGEHPLYCDPRVPQSCPGGVCVHVDRPGFVANMCTHGEVDEPCVPGIDSCQTSLGCTCPTVSGRESCRCSEPAPEGAGCDPRVPGACAAPNDCIIKRGEGPGDISTVCGVDPLRRDAGTDPLACDPAQPFCRPNETCTEVEPGVFRCVPGL